MTVRYAIHCGTCKTAAALAGQMLSDLSAEVTAFMAVHDHGGRDFTVVPVVSCVTAPLPTAVEAPAQRPAQPDRVDAA